MKALPVFAVLLLLVMSCSKDPDIDPDNLLTGIWTYTGSEDETLIFSRSDKFIDNHCYRFNNDGSLLERKNSGWCGTPPISYADYEGTWSAVNDTLVVVDVAFWGGQTNYQLEIIEVSESTLKVRIIYPQ